MEIDIKSQSEIQSLLTPCPFSIYGCTKQDIPVKTIRTHILECKFIPKQCTECLDYVSSTTPHDSTKCTFTCPNCGRKVKSTDFERNFHSQLCNQEPAPSTSQSTQKWNPESWETNLSDFKKYASNNISSLVKIGMESLDTYQKSTAQAKYETSQTRGLKISLPNTTALRDAITAFATACIKQNQESQVTNNPLDSSLHLFLGLAIEECVLCENMFPEVVKVGNVVLDENKAASDSAMSDEVDGLLMSLGVPVSASKEKKLQAIEEEFQRLKGIGSEQANEVQNLYQWKLNQIKHEDGGGDHLESQNKWKKLTLKHALKKYGDSIMISDDSTGANFRYGRMLMLSGNLEKAFVYLQTAVKRRPLHQGARIHLAACAILKQIKPTNSSTTKLYHQLLSEFLTDTQNSQWLNVISSNATANQNQSQQSLLLDDFDSPSATIFPIAHICLARAHFITGAPISTVSNVLKNGLYVFPDLMKQIGRKSTTFSQMKQNFVLLLREELCLEHISDCLNKINSENTTTVAGSGVKHDSKDKVDAIRMLAEKSWDVSSSANASAVGANEELQILWTSPLGALNHCNSQVGEDILKSIYFCSQPITPNNFSSITETLTSLGYFQLNVFDECKKNQLENESSKIRCDLESQIVDTEITFKSALGIINSASTLRKIVDLDWWMKIGELVKSYEDILTKKEEPIKPEGKKSIAPTKKIEVKKPAAPAGKEKSQPPVSKLGPPVKSTAGPSSKQPTSPKKPTLQTPATETKLKSASTSAKQSVENLTDSKQVAKKTEATQKSPTKPPNKATTNSTAAAAAVYLKTKPPSTTQTTKQAAPKTVVNSTSDAVPKPTRPPSAIKKDSPVPAKPEKSTVESADNTKPDLNATSESLFPPPPKTYKAVIGLARTLHRKLILLEEKTNIEKGKAKQTDSKCVDPDLCSEIIKWYTEAISFNPHIIDSYIELAGILESQDPTKISSILGMYPFPATADEWWTNEPSQDDLYFFGEVARYFMKEKKYDDKLLVSLIWLGRKGGVGVIQKYVDQLDSEGGQNMFLMRLYAGINRKDVTSSDMQAFFKAKYWI
ncbi:hypothetical protein HK098_006341 [Nowakowskiella sp. JEL0407]|nr:hypothetical protein HK098_006341 [Nowakowskiella sp. JEL0407]